jgi:SAM-dependent methyltransferase
MENAEELKRIVREKYSNIALASDEKADGCGCCCSDELDYSIFAEDYSKLDGYTAEADLQLGCGMPTEYAGIKPGDTVVDLGSGAGNDCFVALKETGKEGKVIGVDMSVPMVDKARKNAEKLNVKNAEFLLGEIENTPLDGEIADVVISNCVLNLVPDKLAAFRETYRILKPGGHFAVSDIVLNGVLPDKLLKDAEMYAGCVAGALQEKDYLETIEMAGFNEIRVLKKRRLDLPAELLDRYDARELIDQDKGPGIYSITVRAGRKA